jgi:hypothetical protein
MFFCALAISLVCSALNYEKRPWTSPIHSCTLRVHIRWSGLDRGRHRAGRPQSAHTSPQRFICNIDFSFHALYNITLGDIGSMRLYSWQVESYVIQFICQRLALDVWRGVSQCSD